MRAKVSKRSLLTSAVSVWCFVILPILEPVVAESMPASADSQVNGTPEDAPALEDPPKFFSLTPSVGLYSAYMFRGQNLYDGLSLQPSVQGTFSLEDYGNLSFIHWMHIPAQGEQYTTRFVEMDEGVAYDYSLDDVTFTLSHYWYLYPNGNANTFPGSREFLATVSWDTLLNPSVTFADEYRSYKVQYYELGFKQPFDLPGVEGVVLTPFVNFGFATNGTPYWEQDGFVQSTYGVSTTLSVGDLSFTPLLAYSNGTDGYTTDQWWGGVSISLAM